MIELVFAVYYMIVSRFLRSLTGDEVGREDPRLPRHDASLTKGDQAT